MRVPLTWLRDYVDLPVEVEPREVAARLVAVGLEVETVHSAGGDVSGPLVVGQVLDFSDETHRNGKTIRWCQVDVGEAQPRGIVCGALNFSRDDLVVVALPGAVLPGGFEISARKTYGHVSDGMICSARELGLGDDHTGIMVLVPGEGRPGDDAHQLLRLSDDVLDIAVTPDRGYCLSMRGIARETATAYDLPFRDPAAIDVSHEDDGGYPVHVEEPAGCPVFVARTVTDLDPRVPSPRWLQRRVQLAGMRPISLIVDVTNYVMLELGQPIHAYDRARLQGPIGVRRARSGERLRTLDGVVRDLRPDDLLITDESGPIGLAGVMGGASTEIHTDTTDVVIEAAHFDAGTIARGARRHRLPSEASYRFERGVDPELPPVAAQRVVELLVELGGAKVEPGATVVSSPRRSVPIEIAADLPAEVAGRPISHEATRHRLTQVGCTLTGDADLLVSAPSWRPDLVDPFDLVEEVVRLEGYDSIPSVLPTAPAGHGLTTRQRLRRQVGRALAAAGYVEAPSYPFVGPAALDAMGLASDDERRRMVRLVNPLSDEEPFLRTTLLPGLLSALRRNVGRGQADVALFESGLVFRPTGPVQAPRPPVDRRPTDAEVAALERGLPDQPERIAVALAGQREPAGWWGSARPGSWADAIEAARVIGRAAHVDLQVRKGDQAPWHPGRCAAVLLDGQVIGHAGELHPRAVQALGLPDRTSAMELDLNAVFAAAPLIVMAPRISTFPVATQDVALVVDLAVPAAAVEEALREGAGQLLESLRLFDVYTGPQVGAGKRSLAFALRFRAPDRTLTDAEALAARAAAVQLAAERTGAVLRGV